MTTNYIPLSCSTWMWLLNFLQLNNPGNSINTLEKWNMRRKPMPLPSNNLYSIKILSWLMWKSFKSSSHLCFRRWYKQWRIITWPLTSNRFKFQKKKKVDINICSFQSIFQNSKHRKQKKTFKFNFIKMKEKLIFDHIIRYIDYKEPAFNFVRFFFFFFPIYVKL